MTYPNILGTVSEGARTLSDSRDLECIKRVLVMVVIEMESIKHDMNGLIDMSVEVKYEGCMYHRVVVIFSIRSQLSIRFLRRRNRERNQKNGKKK